MAWVEEEFSDEGCVLHEIGWIDEDGNMMEDNVHADLATLNEGVQAGLSEDEVHQCVEDKLAAMAEEHGHCFDQYDAEQTAILEDLGVKITGFKCFMGMFEDACGNYIQTEYVNPLLESLYASAGKK